MNDQLSKLILPDAITIFCILAVYAAVMNLAWIPNCKVAHSGL